MAYSHQDNDGVTLLRSSLLGVSAQLNSKLEDRLIGHSFARQTEASVHCSFPDPWFSAGQSHSAERLPYCSAVLSCTVVFRSVGMHGHT